MDEATKRRLGGLAVVGPVLAWLFRSRPWRVYEHMDARKWTRLAAAITFTSFLAFFPVLALGVAISSRVLDDEGMDTVRDWLADQVPGISENLDLGGLIDNAGTIGLVALLLLLPTGAGWVEATRGCLRELWDLDDPEESALLRRAKDLGVLAGLGGVVLLSLAASGLAVSVARLLAQEAIGGPVGRVLLQIVAHLVAVAITFVLMLYLLVWLPGVRPPRTDTIVACLIGAVGFELLKALLSGYLTGIATRSLYGAFGVPIALLVWMNLMSKLLVFCGAWTATAVTPAERSAADALAADDADGTADAPTAPPPSGSPR
ncbi:YihY/virulence factor BrkB family protein [Streptomyces calidiresistens]|uniref:YihY/virulence factor BrkB family protein n=1 Tax=Streptomyces calidiresistens TaxID=1485586 RepID=A0A7W3T5C5_9ACTN|nr:YihY/virulence factor BrkB family protein [Streptomyces calidiresistens]MBB0231244.1 YihY/virulence factor BrkB family protein [Streptomyces calidiresistens]